jgi:hypothetical protein
MTEITGKKPPMRKFKKKSFYMLIGHEPLTIIIQGIGFVSVTLMVMKCPSRTPTSGTSCDAIPKSIGWLNLVGAKRRWKV